MPRAMSSAAKRNHQNSVGSTSERMITSPARIAAQPHIPPLFPLRTENRPPYLIL